MTSSPRLLAAAAFLTGVSAVSAANYTVTDLGVPLGYRQSTAVDINNNNWIAVNGFNSSTAIGSYVWNAGTYTHIPALAPTTHSATYSINDLNQVVGTEWDSATNTPTGYYYNPLSGTSVQRAFAYSGEDYARVINNQGRILGGATDWGAGSWIYSGGTYFDVDPTVPALSLAYDLNNSGTMLAYNGTLGGYYLWDSTMPGVASPRLVVMGSSGSMTQLNDNGILAGKTGGQLLLANSNLGGWGTAPLTNAGSLGSGVQDVNDINLGGWVVGNFQYSGTATHAFVYDGNALVDLNAWIDPALGWTLSTATGLNDYGYIVGAGYNAQGEYHAFLLSPGAVPEPSTYGLFGAVGLLGTALWRRRLRRNT